MGAREFAFDPNRERQMYGEGISIDQLLTPQLGVFVRAGVNQIESISRTILRRLRVASAGQGRCGTVPEIGWAWAIASSGMCRETSR